MSSKINLDLKNFRHLSSDKHTTTLQHKTDGHQITLYHPALSKESQTQLQALSGISKDAATPSQEDQMKHKMADGGDVGGKVPAPPTPSPNSSPQQKVHNVQEGATKATSVPSDSPINTGDWSHMWKAEGGEVNPKLEQSKEVPPGNTIDYSQFKRKPSSDGGTLDYKKIKEEKKEMNRKEPPKRHKYAEGGEICEHCGGAIPHYSEGDVVEPDVGGVKDIIPERLPDENSMSIPHRIISDKYNDIVEGHNAPAFGDIEGRGVDHQKIMRQQVGPNGEAPQEPDPQALQQAQDEYQEEKNQTSIQAADQAMKAAKVNQASQFFGGQPQPMGIADQQAQDQGLAQQPQPQTADQSQQPQAPAQDQSMGTAGYQGAISEAANIQKEQLAHVIDARQQAMNTWQDQVHQSENERQAHIQDIQNGHIDPNAYWQDHSKVATGIGMILAGFNPSNQPNAAINFLNQQMNRSMEAQKANLDSKNNLLRANLEHYRDMHAAQLMTNAMMNDSLAAQMQKAGLEAKNPLARQAAMNGANTLIQNAAMFQRQLDMQQTMMKLANGGGSPDSQGQAIAMMSAINPEHAQVYRAAYVPGIGLSKSLTPIPEGVREQLVSGQKLQNAASDLLNYSKSHTNINPLSAEYKVGTQKALILQQMVREGLLGTVFRDSEKPLLNAFVAENPAGALKKINSDPKIRTLLESSVNQMNTLKQNYGLPISQQAAQPQYKTVNGVKYMRGPNGQAIPVK